MDGTATQPPHFAPAVSRAPLLEASLRYAPFSFQKHQLNLIQNCIQSSCTTVYNLALDRGRRSLQFVNILMRTLLMSPFFIYVSEKRSTMVIKCLPFKFAAFFDSKNFFSIFLFILINSIEIFIYLCYNVTG